jgi:cell division transport system permease protein
MSMRGDGHGLTLLQRLSLPPWGGAPAIVPGSGWAAALTALSALAMSYLAVLTLAAGIAADRLAGTWHSELTAVATVRISVAPEVLEARVTAALAVLASAPGVADARLLSDAEHMFLLEPWLGAGNWLDDLPVPRLIEIRLDGPGPEPAVLQAQLDAAAPGAVYDDHALWRGPLVRAATVLRRLAWFATTLIALAAAGMVALAARATLAGNAEVVRVIRLIGGEESFIENAFVRRLASRAALGGLVAAAIAWTTARHSVRLMLRQMY